MWSLTQTPAKPSSSAWRAALVMASGPATRPYCGRWTAIFMAVILPAAAANRNPSSGSGVGLDERLRLGDVALEQVAGVDHLGHRVEVGVGVRRLVRVEAGEGRGVERGLLAVEPAPAR